MATFTSDDFNADLLNQFGVQSTINFLTFTDLEESVRADVRTLRMNSFIPAGIPITGLVYDVSKKALIEVTRA